MDDGTRSIVNEQDPWLTVEQVAALLTVAEETVRRWIRQGALPVLDLGGRKTGYRIRRSDLERFVEERYVPAAFRRPRD